MDIGRIGFRIIEVNKRPEKRLIEEFRKYAIPNIADAMGRFRVMDPGLRCITKGKAVVGPAVTVMTRPADNLMVHKAMEVACPGDIIVVNTCGCKNGAVWGELMTYSALKLNIAGLVVDGAIRDEKEINKLGFPVFARNVAASGCDKDGPGEINCSISCGGVVVNPGDIIAASSEGIVVVPLGDAEEVLKTVQKIREKEQNRIHEINNDMVLKEDIDKILKDKGII